MGFPLSLDQQDYEALIALSRKGAIGDDGTIDPNKLRQVDSFLRVIEVKNDIVRDGVWIQWQEADQPLPPNVDFPEVWPPQLRFYLELTTRPVAKADVDEVIKAKASKPVTVLVTRDPGAVVGWTDIDSFFFT